VVVLVAVSAAASAFVYARLQTPVYRSTVRLEVSARFDNGQQLALERLLPQLAQRVRTSEVAREVDARLQLDLGADAILSRLRAEAVGQSGQIHIEADDVDPGRAEAIVFETARVFEEQHAARNQGVPSQDRAIVSILDRPAAARLVWPQSRVVLGVAALLGLLVGGVLAFGLEYLDDTLKSAEDVERTLGLHTLGRIPAGGGLLVPTSAASGDVQAAGVRGRSP
jgi:capsular polysaccharide biosynthesis protein